MVLSTRTIGEEWVRAAVRSLMRAERRTVPSNGPGSSSREHREEHLVQQICSRNQGHLADMVVTPKEIDMLVGWASELIAAILNRALHPFLPEPLLRRYLMEIV